ncbi:DUF6526 family protein [Flavobacterium rhizosphaerae]|uniref:DUF6526 family protein n=1 Tax=Flavobacterium rhizosphaerae TaxID=3163298 RepID=A0ABW8Z1V9_9FLAO
MANKQNYKNHIRWYIPHHFVFYPVMLAAIIYCAWQAANATADVKPLWLVAGFGFFSLAWLSFLLRQHYALTLQNRLVLQELRYRYFVLTGKRLEPIEAQLSEGQLFALRFAPDEELAALADRAISEKLTANEIKKAIKNWKGDYHRV